MLRSFVFLSNRAAKVFEQAYVPLGGVPYQNGVHNIDVLYYCTFGGKAKPIANIGYDLVDRKLTIPLDDKAKFAKALQGAGLEVLKTYFSPSELPENPDALWYVKNPLAAGGKDIFCVQTADVESVFKEGFIIQEAVTDVDLLNLRKYTIRVYVLYFAGCLYCFNDGLLVIHGKEYQKDDLGAEAQFLHLGYDKTEGAVKLEKFSDHPHYQALLGKIEHKVAEVFQIYLSSLSQSSESAYCIFGVDILVRESLEPVIIEINDRPNFVHNQDINQNVNVPMLQAMLGVFRPEVLPALQTPTRRYNKVSMIRGSDPLKLHDQVI